MPLQAFRKSQLQAFESCAFLKERTWDNGENINEIGFNSALGEIVSKVDGFNIKYFDLDGVEQSTWNYPGGGTQRHHFGSDDLVWAIGDVGGFDITSRNSVGTLINQWDVTNSVTATINAIFFLSNEVYVAQSETSPTAEKVRVYNTSGVEQRSWSVTEAQDLFINNSEVYVLDFQGGASPHDIDVYSTAGVLQRSFTIPNDVTNTFPSGNDFIAISPPFSADNFARLISSTGDVICSIDNQHQGQFGVTVGAETFIGFVGPSPSPSLQVYKIARGLQSK